MTPGAAEIGPQRPLWRSLRHEALVAAWSLRLPDVGPSSDAWRSEAVCAGVTALFYDSQHESVALTACRRLCPVRVECRQQCHAEEKRIPLEDVLGVRGGLTAEQRAEFYREFPELRQLQRTRVAKCGSDAGYYRHRNAGEEACDECKAAHSTVTNQREIAARQRPVGDTHDAVIVNGRVPASDPLEALDRWVPWESMPA